MLTAAVALPGATPTEMTARSADGVALPSLDCIHVGRSRCSSPSSCVAHDTNSVRSRPMRGPLQSWTGLHGQATERRRFCQQILFMAG